MIYRQRQQIVYLEVVRRSSKEEQARQWHSIDRQLMRFQQWREDHSAICLGQFTIDCSAKDGKNFRSAEMKAVWRKIQSLRHKLTHVLWTDVDRYGRSGSAIPWFEKVMALGVEVNFIDEWFDFSYPESISRFYARLGDAQAEIMRLSIRTCKGKAGLRESGYYNDTLPACYQYEKERRPDGRKYAQAVEPAFEAYQIAVQSFDKGSNQAQAIRKAQEQTGYNISTSAFSRFLMMSLPYGYVPVWDNYKIPIHARIMVDMIPCQNVPSMFDDINQFYRIRDRIRKTTGGSTGRAREPFNPDFPLSYSCPCGCGAPVRGYYANPKRKTPTPYYDCKHCGKETRVHRKKANAFIAEMLNSIQLKEGMLALAEKGASKALHTVGQSDATRIGQLKKTLTDIGAKMDHLDNNLTRYSPEVFSATRERLERQRIEIQAKIQDVENERTAGLDVRTKLMSFLAQMGDWFTNEANGYQQAKLMATLFPDGYTITQSGVRTGQINLILEAIATIPEVYKIKKGENGANTLFSPRSGRTRAEGRTIKADIIALQDFFASLKNVA